MANARFWTFHNDGWIKITLRPLQRLSHHEGGPTDEGYSYTTTTWTHAGPFLLVEWSNVSKDCDGHMDSGGEAQCPLADLKAAECPCYDLDEKGLPIRCPLYADVETNQRDYAAEAAGY